MLRRAHSAFMRSKNFFLLKPNEFTKFADLLKIRKYDGFCAAKVRRGAACCLTQGQSGTSYESLYTSARKNFLVYQAVELRMP